VADLKSDPQNLNQGELLALVEPRFFCTLIADLSAASLPRMI